LAGPRQGDALTITPRGGLIDDGQGNQALAYGAILNIFEPRGTNYGGQQLEGPGYGQRAGQTSATRLEQSPTSWFRSFACRTATCA